MKRAIVYTSTNITANLDRVASGGFFVFTNELSIEIACFHGRFETSSRRVKFLKTDIDAVRAWVTAKPGRKIICCFDNYLPHDLRSFIFMRTKFPIIAKQSVEKRGYKVEFTPDYNSPYEPLTPLSDLKEEEYKGKTYIYAF